MSEKAKVYFTKTINPEKIVEIYKKLNINLPGKVGVKVHSGEAGNKNFLKPELFKPMVDYVNGTIIETNAGGPTDDSLSKRTTTKSHTKVLGDHEWLKVFPNKVELLDSEGPDIKLDIPNGLILKSNLIGKNTKKYDSILVLAHFKGHVFGGYGGALKQLSIGCASSVGKNLIHSAGKNSDGFKFMENICGDKEFKESMADAAYSVVNLFKGKMAFINIMANISIDCDCVPNPQPPCMKDIGILASTDPVAIDQACLDLIYNSSDSGKAKLIERIDQRLGKHIIESSVKLGTGTDQYELINIDN